MEQEPPKIEFPCENYPIKVIGDNGDDFATMVIGVMQRFVVDFDHNTVSLNPSRNGTFVSVRLSITATGPDQLKNIHEALLATGRVKMVL